MGPYDFIDPLNFNALEYLASGGLLGHKDPALGKELMLELLNPDLPENYKSKIRKTLTKNDPVLFSLIYLDKHISDEQGNVTFSRFHLDTLGWARDVMPHADSLPISEKRMAFIAPRQAGKSTILFLVIPTWSLAFRHQKFITAFGASAEPIEDHLKTFRDEMATNELLRMDFPRLTTPKVDRSSLYHSQSNVGFSAKGLDRTTRGAKLGTEGTRPTAILFDDVEPGESNYSDKEIEKRKTTILNDIIGGDPSAVVNFVGTVTRAGSIMHDILRTQTENEDVSWVAEQQIACRYYPALITNPDGSKVSMWQNNSREEWTTEWMLANEKTNQFQVEKMNNPMGKQGKYWSLDDIRITPEDRKNLPGTRYILMVDPSITTKESSDWTGLAVVGYTPAMAGRNPQIEIIASRRVKLVNEDLRMHAIKILNEFPDIRYVRVEVNQGGDLWGIAHKPHEPRSRSGVFHHLPEGVGLMIGTTTLNKEIKFAQAHDFYQKPGFDIYHREHFGELERELIEFPKARWDDLADACVMGILYFLKPAASKKIRTGSTEYSYL
jgi:hypothetical protein